MTLPEAALLIAAGLAGGVVNSMAGGGSLIVFPAYVAIGYPTLAANVTNSVAQWPGYLGGVLGFQPQLRGQRDRAARLAAVVAAGSVGGSAALLVLPPGSFDVAVPFLVLLATLLLALQPRISRLVGPREDGYGSGETGPPEDGSGEAGPPDRRAAYPAMFLAGAYGGYFGGALGVIVIGVLGLTMHETLRRISALKTVLSLAAGTVTLVLFGLLGPVNWTGVVLVAPATLVGGLLGARIARRLDDRVLRSCMVAFGIGVSVYLFLRI